MLKISNILQTGSFVFYFTILMIVDVECIVFNYVSVISAILLEINDFFKKVTGLDVRSHLPVRVTAYGYLWKFTKIDLFHS